MKKFIKKALPVVTAAAIALSLSACGKKDDAQKQAEEQAAKEVRMNDYRGAYCRTSAIRSNVVTFMEAMKENNKTIRSDNPNSYWTKEGYQDFVSDFLSCDIAQETQWFNEEETDWSTIVSQMSSRDYRFTSGTDGDGYKLKSGVSIVRNEKDDYSITGVKNDETSDYGASTTVYRALYDCDKDWCKAYRQTTLSGETDVPSFTDDMFEYGRIDDNTFVIQTSKERLYVKFEPVDKDTDIRKRTISEFYYSKLISDGTRTTFEPFKPLSLYDSATNEYVQENEKYNETMSLYPFLNEKGDLADKYGANDSVFLRNISELAPEWVFEDRSLQQAITYKGGNLVVTTYNKLSESYERFIYAIEGADETLIPELENMVAIKNLVGVIKADASSEGTSASNSNAADMSSSADNSSASETASQSADTSSANSVAATAASSESPTTTTPASETSAIDSKE